jgi:flagellar biosynthesis/type III secretory pathway chaperone
MHAQDLQPELKVHLDVQIAAAEQLFKTLEDERAALKGTDAQALDRAGAAKVAALTRFEQLEQERRLMCQGHAERAPFERLIDALDRQVALQSPGFSIRPDATLRASWQRLLELTGRCRDANQANGLIVSHRQKQIRQLLGVLRGGGGAETYDPSGARSSTAGARAIARA